MISAAMCFLSDDIHDYYNVAQGKITIPNVDDGEECTLTDVSPLVKKRKKKPKTYPLCTQQLYLSLVFRYR